MRRGLAFAALLALAALVPAHVPLVNPSNGMRLRWLVPDPIGIVIQSTGSDDITDGSHTTAIRNAIAAWNGASGSTARLVENSNPAQRARTDWSSDSVHLVLFDENDDSGYFPGGSGVVAITPVWFSSSGAITDADVLFNGKTFHFTTARTPGRFDVQDVATHELGHLLGLDHSGWAGASMYPYVDPTVLLHRSLSQDELHGLRESYPAGPDARVHGFLEHASGSALKGAQVVALDSAGRPCAAALSNNVGLWRLYGLEAGNYTLYAAPVDEPVAGSNFGAGHPVQIDFRRTELGSLSVSLGQDADLGTQAVLAASALELGRVSDDFPKRVVRGMGTILILHGAGLVDGSTLVCSDPNVLVNVLQWHDTRMQFSVDVPADEPDVDLDLTVTNAAGEKRTLVAGLEVTPPDPVVDTVVPAYATDGGGTLVTLHGANFRVGQRVVIGANIQVVGTPGGCELLDENTLQLHTLASDPGSCDVVVIDPSGVEGRKANGIVFAHVPEVQSTFPTGGYAGGGTSMLLRGQNFEAGAVVRIDGVPQTLVVQSGTTELVVTTNAGIPGGPYLLEVENPGGAIATSAFSYSATPDPLLDSIDPPSGAPSGGDTIRIHGSNFNAASSVRFGADALTGAGGTPASSVQLVDANTLEIVTPPHASGAQNVLVYDGSTGQATLAPAAFTFHSSGKSGGGGCYTLPHTPPAGPRDLLAGAWWLCALLLLAARAQLRPRRVPAIA